VGRDTADVLAVSGRGAAEVAGREVARVGLGLDGGGLDGARDVVDGGGRAPRVEGGEEAGAEKRVGCKWPGQAASPADGRLHDVVLSIKRANGGASSEMERERTRALVAPGAGMGTRKFS
jgi:hypothetical protein